MIEKILQRRYGQIPKPTPGEEKTMPHLIESGKYLAGQEEADISTLVLAARLTDDPEIVKAALERYNEATGENVTSIGTILFLPSGFLTSRSHRDF